MFAGPLVSWYVPVGTADLSGCATGYIPIKTELLPAGLHAQATGIPRAEHRRKATQSATINEPLEHQAIRDVTSYTDPCTVSAHTLAPLSPITWLPEHNLYLQTHAIVPCS